jgi:hypothetical protein
MQKFIYVMACAVLPSASAFCFCVHLLPCWLIVFECCHCHLFLPVGVCVLPSPIHIRCRFVLCVFHFLIQQLIGSYKLNWFKISWGFCQEVCFFLFKFVCLLFLFVCFFFIEFYKEVRTCDLDSCVTLLQWIGKNV